MSTNSVSTGTRAKAPAQEPPEPTDEAALPLSFPLSVVFTSDWGVGTGTGVAGGVRSLVEKDRRGLPVVRGTVLAGAVREQAALVAEALDGDAPEDAPRKGGWRHFTEALFGKAAQPRLVTFTDAVVTHAPSAGGESSEHGKSVVHEVVSLKIDDRTGTAEEDHLRFLERAGACTLSGQVELVTVDPRGRPIAWDAQQRWAARLVLTLSALLVRAIGSHRTDGDGECTVLLGERIEDEDPGLAQRQARRQAREVRTRCRAWLREKWAQTAPQAPAPQDADAQPQASTPHLPTRDPHAQGEDERASAGSISLETTYRQANLDITLDTPVISYETPMFNEVRSLDFLRGTALLPLVHRRLRRRLPHNHLVRDAVVAGDLLVSDARAVVGDTLGLPVPLVLSRPKVERGATGATPPAAAAEATATEETGQSRTAGAAQESRLLYVTNRLRAPEPSEVHTPVRSGYVFPRTLSAEAGGSPHAALGAPALVGRQSIALDPLTGAAGEGQLFLVRALPEGLRMRATVTMSERLYREVQDHLPVAFPQESFPERIGSWRLSGTYGRATCRLGGFSPAPFPKRGWTEQAAESGTARRTTLWFTSDVLVRSRALGPGGTLEDLLDALGKAGARVRLADEGCSDGCDGSCFTAGVRHRRVDSWAGADRQPRATRMAIQAGSVLTVSPAGDADPDTVMETLARLSVTGIGELTAQGFGRFEIGHWLLGEKKLWLSRLCAAAFTASAGTSPARPEATTARTEKSQ